MSANVYLQQHRESPPDVGLVVLREDFGEDPGGDPVGWLDDANGICDEVWRIVHDAQGVAHANGSSLIDMTTIGPIKDYMEQLKGLFPKAGP